jgi:hypothetical protein
MARDDAQTAIENLQLKRQLQEVMLRLEGLHIQIISLHARMDREDFGVPLERKRSPDDGN